MLNTILPKVSLTLVIYAAVAAIVGGYIWHCERTKSNWKEAQAIAQRQIAENAKQALRDLKNKERSDENYQRNIARVAADVRRLRDSRPRFVPAGGASPGGAAAACYDREQLNSALQRFREGIVGLVGEGAAAVEGLNEAKGWVNGR